MQVGAPPPRSGKRGRGHAGPGDDAARGGGSGAGFSFTAYRSSVNTLGTFPDKYLIQNLTQMAERAPDSVKRPIVDHMESVICDPHIKPERKLPLCYLIDSMLKNIGGVYIALFGENVVRWFPRAYEMVDAKAQFSMARVLGTWEQTRLFPEESLRQLRMLVGGEPAAALPFAPVVRGGHYGPQTVSVPPVVPVETLAVQLPPPPPPPPKSIPAEVQKLSTGHVAPPPPPPLAPLVTSGPLRPAVGSREYHSLVDACMADLLKDSIETLGYDKVMTMEDLWRVNPELAMEFRTVAEAQVQQDHTVLPPATLSPTAASSTVQPMLVEKQSGKSTGLKHDKINLKGASEAAHIVVRSLDAAVAAPPEDVDQMVAAVLPSVMTIMERLGVIGGASQSGSTGNVKEEGSKSEDPRLKEWLKDTWHRYTLTQHSTGDPAVHKLYEGLPFHCKQDGQRFAKQGELDSHLDLLFKRRRTRREQTAAACRPWYCTIEQWVTDFGSKGKGKVVPAGAGVSPQPGVGKQHQAGVGSQSGGAIQGIGGPDTAQLSVSGMHIDGSHNSNTTGKKGRGDRGGSDDRGAKVSQVHGNAVIADENQTMCRICGETFDMYFDSYVDQWMYRDACVAQVTGGGHIQSVIVHKLCLKSARVDEHGRIAYSDLVAVDASSSASINGLERSNSMSISQEDNETDSERPLKRNKL